MGSPVEYHEDAGSGDGEANHEQAETAHELTHDRLLMPTTAGDWGHH
jgi:hypothetical protein